MTWIIKKIVQKSIFPFINRKKYQKNKISCFVLFIKVASICSHNLLTILIQHSEAVY